MGLVKLHKACLLKVILKKNLSCERVAPFNERYLDPIVNSNKYRRKIVNFIKENNIPSNQFNEAFVSCYAIDIMNTIIIPKMMEGKIVITDRYLESSFLNLHLLGLTSLWADIINEKILTPDLWIFIDVMPEICHKRIVDRGIPINNVYESIEGLRTQREFYLSMQKEFKFNIINGNTSCEEVFQSIKCSLSNL
jgi:thymidylate kinase